MKKRFAKRAVLCGILSLLLPACAWAAPIGTAEIPAETENAFEAATVIDLDADTVLYTKDGERVFSPTGGAVNLMTAYVVAQEADWDQEIPVIDGVNQLSEGTRKLGLAPGARWLIKDLTAAMLLYGAQDAALVLCDHLTDSQDEFVKLMNLYAAKLGMDSTVYANPLGAYSSDQTTTVSDLALLCKAVLGNDTLRELVAKSTYDTQNGKTIENRMGVMREGRTGYDARIKGMGEGSTASAGTNTLLYAADGERNFLFIGYDKINDQSASEKNALRVIDFFSERVCNL